MEKIVRMSKIITACRYCPFNKVGLSFGDLPGAHQPKDVPPQCRITNEDIDRDSLPESCPLTDATKQESLTYRLDNTIPRWEAWMLIDE